MEALLQKRQKVLHTSCRHIISDLALIRLIVSNEQIWWLQCIIIYSLNAKQNILANTLKTVLNVKKGQINQIEPEYFLLWDVNKIIQSD